MTGPNLIIASQLISIISTADGTDKIYVQSVFTFLRCYTNLTFDNVFHFNIKQFKNTLYKVKLLHNLSSLF